MKKTTTIELMNYDKLMADHNASVTVMFDSRRDIEDAVIVNRSLMDRGFSRTFYFRRY